MNNDLKFYVFCNENIIDNKGYVGGLTLNKAIEVFKSVKTNKYTTLGVEYSKESCDLLIFKNGILKISNDYQIVDFTKNNDFIKINLINILKEGFNL